MAAKLSTYFLGPGLTGLDSSKQPKKNVCLIFPSHRRFLPATCNRRPRGFNSQYKRQLSRKDSPQQPEVDDNLQPNNNNSESDNASVSSISSLTEESTANDDADNVLSEKRPNVTRGDSLKLLEVDNSQASLPADSSSKLTPPLENSDLYIKGIVSEETGIASEETRSSSINLCSGEQLLTIEHDDLINMIKNAEKNILLLNEARVHALEDLENILSEKEALQGSVNILEMRRAEAGTEIEVASQEKIYLQLPEEQLEKMKNELAVRSGAGGTNHDSSGNQNLQMHDSKFFYLNEELVSLRAENMSLKDGVERLKCEISSVKATNKQVVMLEKERYVLESAVRDLKMKLAASEGDAAQLSTLKFDYKNLLDKVRNLQALLDKATKQADKAILELQKNQELHKKVHMLEESLEEANVHKLSSEKLQQYNMLMQQKIKLMEEHLQNSDNDIQQSYVQLYQESIKEFQDTLNSLKEEIKIRSLDGPVDDMPWESWSHLLLKIDGWLLEKKLSSIDAKMLREMAWKRDRRILLPYLACKGKTEHESLAIFSGRTSAPSRSGMHIVHIAAEMAPVAKVGGLGDVVMGLGKALQKKGHLVEIVLPKYDCMQYNFIHDLRVLDVVMESYFEGQLFKNKIWVGTVEGLPVYFIEPHHPYGFFLRGKYYGEHDDFKRFSFFCRAALELLLQAGKKPDIIHCHDWQTAFVAPLYWDIYAHKGLNSARICFTCHNFEHQGVAPASELASCGLDAHRLNRPDRLQDNSAHDRVNLVKGAVVFSNIVTTVSPTYAQEVRTPEGGRGLHITLNSHYRKFTGILNGIDTDSWNPALDTFLKVQYDSGDLQGKAENKEGLRKQLGLSSANVKKPLVCCITRLVPQKGVHLIRHAIYRTIEMGGQFVLLGSSPVQHIQSEFEGIARQFQNRGQARLILKYDESLSHFIYAASDMFIIPSIFEPCGLTQMIAMRYGSIPIARKIGGLNDSVFDVDDDTIPLQFRNGYTFSSPDEQGLNTALDRALKHYMRDKNGWTQLVRKVMAIDFSWESSASQYEELYERAVARARAAKQI